MNQSLSRFTAVLLLVNVLAIASLPGCTASTPPPQTPTGKTGTSQKVATVVSNVGKSITTLASDLPAAMTTELQKFATVHPDLVGDVAGCLTDGAKFLKAMPTATAMDDMLFLWKRYDSKVDVAVTAFEGIYALYYATLPTDVSGLTAIASALTNATTANVAVAWAGGKSHQVGAVLSPLDRVRTAAIRA